jgi:hypothetical protein
MLNGTLLSSGLMVFYTRKNFLVSTARSLELIVDQWNGKQLKVACFGKQFSNFKQVFDVKTEK